MKTLLSVLIGVLLVGCAAAGPKKIKARITTYSSNEKRNDKWTRKGISATGVKLQNTKSVAIDPKLIPYFSKVKLPCFEHLLCCVDTGSAVVKRTASKKLGVDLPIIDIYFKFERDAAEFRQKTPIYMDVLVYNK